MDWSEEDLTFMGMALEEARKASLHDDIPVGAVLVRGGRPVATGRNEREVLHLPAAHAEIQALNKAGALSGHWNLTGSRLYVTLEPCVMCAGALVLARVEEVIYAAADPKGGALSLGISILQNPALNHRVRFRRGPLEAEASALLKEFFRNKRQKKLEKA